MSDPMIEYDDIDGRRRGLYRSYDAYFTRRCQEAYAGREQHWDRHYGSIPEYLRSVEPMRRQFAEMVGYGGQPEAAPEPEWQEVASTDGYRVRRLWINVLPGVRMDALYLTPRTAAAPLPLVVAQHGLCGTPEEACGFVHDAIRSDYSYHRMGIRLAERGFAVIAPHMVGGYGTNEGGARFVPELGDAEWARARTQLYRKAYLAGERLYGTELMAISRLLDYVATQPEVDAERIGFYGLSQGGQTALFLPALDTRIRVSVSSAFFQRRLGKMIDYDNPVTPYVKSFEEDKFFPGWLKYFDDADVVSLICPRAFAGETGRKDQAVWYEHSRAAYEEARQHYVRLGLADRVAYFEHEDGHVARGIESIDFIAKHLELP
ncbi:MAG: alpha/beta hydrolase [Anaerolineae bacterium]